MPAFIFSYLVWNVTVPRFDSSELAGRVRLRLVCRAAFWLHRVHVPASARDQGQEFRGDRRAFPKGRQKGAGQRQERRRGIAAAQNCDARLRAPPPPPSTASYASQSFGESRLGAIDSSANVQTLLQSDAQHWEFFGNAEKLTLNGGFN